MKLELNKLNMKRNSEMNKDGFEWEKMKQNNKLIDQEC